jgi:hypothetical protein
MSKGNLRSNGGFRMTTPIQVQAWDPGIKGMSTKPTKPSHRTVTMGVIMGDGGFIINGMMTGTAFAGATGTFTVADNTFPAPVELVLGDYRLVNSIDYIIGAAATDTAHNIAAAISTLPGWSATHNLAVVTVVYVYPADDIEFRAVHHGGVLSFTTFSGGGYLTKGVPYAGPPVLT